MVQVYGVLHNPAQFGEHGLFIVAVTTAVEQTRTRFDLVTAQQLSTAATLSNNRPRRCLSYRTPAEVLAGEFHRLRCISDS